MKGEVWELMIEFFLILLSPIIYHFYLWKYKQVDKSVLFQNAKIYVFLYVLVGAAAVVLMLK